MEKDYLLKVLTKLDNKKPSEWDLAMITYLKTNWLPRLKKFLNGEKEERNIIDEAKEIFK